MRHKGFLHNAAAVVLAVAFMLALAISGSANAADTPDAQGGLSNQPVADGAAISNQPDDGKVKKTWEIYVYQSSFRRDPFMSLIRTDDPDDDKTKPPLQRYDVSQMKLVAVVLQVGDAYALVKLPDGTHHTIRYNDQVGIHDGTVVDIKQSSVMVREKKFDYKHVLVDVDYEMKLREEEKK